MINIDKVTKSFGNLKAVDNLSLNIKDGEIFGFLGPNGAGKSTTLKMITGIVPPDSGTIEVDGHSIKGDTLKAKQQFGFVPDSPDVFLRLKGREYLNFIASVYKIPAQLATQRVEKLVKEFEMGAALGEMIANYSHGMRQKIIIIGVLMINPKNWILDEPMTGLDPSSSYLLKTKMREHAENGNAVLFSTHVLEVAEKLCDRVGIINHGQLIFVGTLEELKASKGENESLESLFLELTK